MPRYDYLCAACGPFTESLPMAESAMPRSCPACKAAAPRVILSAPRIAAMSLDRRGAHATNEKSAHAPRASGGRHSPGCSCCGSPGRKAFVADAPTLAKSFVGKRPWMISH